MAEIAEKLTAIHEEENRYDAELYRRFWAWKDRQPSLSQRAVAALLEVSEASLREYKYKRFRGNLTVLEATIEALLDREERLTPPYGPSYVNTEVAQEAIDFLAVCQEQGLLGILHGPAGCGKTCALAMFRTARPGAIILTASPKWRSPDALSQALGAALRAYSDDGLIIRHLKWSGSLVVIDEAQHMMFCVVEHVRYLHDAAGAGIVLVGTPDLVKNLKRRHHEQLERRAYFRRVGYTVSPEDIEAVARMICPDLKADALAFLRGQGAAVGRLGRVQKLLRAAALLSGGRKIDLAALHEATSWATAECSTGRF